jgi:hypothetical protein
MPPEREEKIFHKFWLFSRWHDNAGATNKEPSNVQWSVSKIANVGWFGKSAPQSELCGQNSSKELKKLPESV